MIYRQIEKEKNEWISVKFRLPLKFYLKKYKGKMNALHRILSNGQNTFIGTSNRNFWKNISNGFYRTYFGVHHIYFVYILKIDERKQSKISRELSIRIRKILNVKVEVLPFESFDEVDFLLLSVPHGLSNFKKIKS